MRAQVAVLLFKDFETLDVFGPVEIFGRLTDMYRVRFFSLQGGVVTNEHGVAIQTEKLEQIHAGADIFLIPGGHGTRTEVNNLPLLEAITQVALKSQFVLTVCTGSGLLAKTGLLDGRVATSNKRAFEWAVSNSLKVHWNKNARWTVDGNYYTSAGVSAGMDMALGFLADRHGIEFARNVAYRIEYNWIEDKENDSFKVEETDV